MTPEFRLMVAASSCTPLIHAAVLLATDPCRALALGLIIVAQAARALIGFDDAKAQSNSAGNRPRDRALDAPERRGERCDARGL
jgi:hypothetical protein